MAESYGFSEWGLTSEEIFKQNFPLHQACRDGMVENLSLFLLKAQNGVYVEDNFYGWTPAHWAAYFGKLHCLMLLFQRGCNCDASTSRLSQTLAHLAAFANQSLCLKWCLHCGANVNKQLGCLRKLMTVTRVGVDCNIPSSRFQQTPAHLSAFGDHPHCLQWLLQSKANSDTQDYLGETPAHKAARTGSMECASLLAAHGARLYIRNHSNLTAAQLAAACGHGECARYLEAAATLQESEAKGIYGQVSPQPAQSLKPAFHDVTAREPQSTMQCINGHQNFPRPVTNCFLNGSSDCHQDCAMDESDSQGPIGAGGDFSSPHLANGHTGGDVTTHMGICTNVVPVAGRKRTREDAEEIQYKRMKKCDMESCPILVDESPQSFPASPPSRVEAPDLCYPFSDVFNLPTEPMKPVVGTSAGQRVPDNRDDSHYCIFAV